MDEDFEMEALAVIARALEPLEHETRVRVLKWAEDRFVEGPKRAIDALAWASVDAQIKAYKQYAAELGVDDRQLAHALAHVRSVARLAPVDTDPDPVATGFAAEESLAS